MRYYIGQYIMYSNRGVCKVEDIGRPYFLLSSEKEYYTLRPSFTTNDEHIYILVNTDVYMRKAMELNEVDGYLERLKRMEIKPCRSTKTAVLIAHYQELLCSCDTDKYLKCLITFTLSCEMQVDEELRVV